jgi:diguanylate cyclase (GGDEF)-like protein/PAS domain S-box-containing protein
MDAGARARILDLLPDLVVVVDGEGRIVDANDTAEDQLGYDRDHVVGTSVFDFVHPDDLEYALRNFEARSADSGAGLIVQIRVRHADGGWRVFDLIGRSVLDDPDLQGMPEHPQMIVSLRDPQRASALVTNAARVRALVDKTNDMMLLVDGGGTVLFANQAVTRLLGHDCDALAGRPFASLFDEAEAIQAAGHLAELVRGVGRRTGWRARVVGRDGDRPPCDISASYQLDDPVIRGIIVSMRDVTDLAEMEDLLRAQNEQLAIEANEDSLTGLLNRSAFRRRVAAALEEPEGDRIAVLFVDLDQFKQVNDDHGHDAGDQVLRAVARRLATAVRDGDVLARYGGDEFTVLCGGVRDEAMAAAIVDRVARAVNAPLAVGGVLMPVGASVGYALVGPDRDIDALLQEADRAMYRHKRSGSLSA